MLDLRTLTVRVVHFKYSERQPDYEPRRLAQDLSHPLITTLQQECTRKSCPEMKAGEWLYLCVAHGNDSAMEVRAYVLDTHPVSNDATSNAVPLIILYIPWTVLQRFSTLLGHSPPGTCFRL